MAFMPNSSCVRWLIFHPKRERLQKTQPRASEALIVTVNSGNQIFLFDDLL